ncbi:MULTISPECIES: hypothetical protein [unclassified Mycobacterium]|uniref:TPR repeat region-containing protein n=1 Tax=unclassified Mycobacterium TaxID=2642494 RepID=UPI000993A501|nr:MULTISPECIES: hypothetical protein [unclassified Mycobacterium]
MGMTLDELQHWPPQIKALADAASKRGDASQQAADKVQAIIDMSTWKGDAGDAARDAMKRSAARFETAGFEAMYVAMHANKAYGESQALADDIASFLAYAAAPPKVDIYPKTNTVTPPDITGLNKDQLQKVIDKLKDLHQRVTGLVARGEMLDDSLARVLDEGTGGHTMAEKQIAEGSPEQAERDVHDVLAGTATEEQKARVQAASILSPEQISDRDAGRPVQLTRSQQQVLGQLQAQMNGMSVEDIHRAERRLGNNKSIIGNALQMMGSNQYGYAKTELRPGAEGSTTELTTGGYDKLPTSVQNALNESRPPYTPNYPPGTYNVDPSVGNLNRLSEVLIDGDQGFQRGTELDHKLLQRGADILHYENESGHTALAPVDQELQNIFAATGRDHIAVHDIVTATDSHRNDQFLKDLTHHQFPDLGLAAGSLVSWTGDSAHPGPGVSLEDARISGETARAYASYVAGPGSELNKLSNSIDGRTHTLGEISPGLAQGMARGLAPYTAAIGGGDPDVFGTTPGFNGPLDSQNDIDNAMMPKAKALVTVLSTDSDAAKTLDGALYANSIRSMDHYAEQVQHNNADSTGDLTDAGRFRGLADAGLIAANDAQQNAATKSDFDRAQNLYEIKQLAYGEAQKVLAFGAGTAGGPALGAGVDITAEALKSGIIGPAPTAGQTFDTTAPNMSIAQSQQLLANSLLANGVLQPNQITVPDILANDQSAGPTHPRLRTYEEMVAIKGNVYSIADYQTDMTRVIRLVPGQENNAGYLERTYNNAVKATK